MVRDSLISDCVKAASASNPEEAVAQVLRTCIQSPDINELDGEEEEVCLFRSATLTLMSIRQTPNVLFPPHEHGMTAIIANYQGDEAVKLFELRRGGLECINEIIVGAGSVTVFGPRAIHAVANIGSNYSRAVHAYLGDLIGTARSIWRPGSHERVAYSDEAYFALSEPYDRAKPFVRPAQSHAHSLR